MSSTPLNMTMEHNNECLEDEANGVVFRFHVHFPGCSLSVFFSHSECFLVS